MAASNLALQMGIKPVFVDVCPYTLNISIDDAEKKITSKTKAILAVNLLGNPYGLLLYT